MTQDSPLFRFDSTELSNRFELQIQYRGSAGTEGQPRRLSPRSLWRRALEFGLSQRGNQSLVRVDLQRRQRRLQEPARLKEVSGTSLLAANRQIKPFSAAAARIKSTVSHVRLGGPRTSDSPLTALTARPIWLDFQIVQLVCNHHDHIPGSQISPMMNSCLCPYADRFSPHSLNL
jgi:hypothetical protein